jgi:diaminopimelate decarboxylase
LTSIIASPNLEIRPSTASINASNHLVIGGCDTVDLAEKFGTPLWVIDEETIRQATRSCFAGLSGYPNSKIFYAGKAFLCLAMCKLIENLGLCLDVVSGGELFTALTAGFPAHKIFMHGNNKSANEIIAAVDTKKVTIVADNHSELEMIAAIARKKGARTPILLRMTPGVEPETHQHIKTGQHDSKFGFALEDLDSAMAIVLAAGDALELKGLHAHIGSQTHKIEPYLEIIDILADCFAQVKEKYKIDLPLLDVGGGLGIAYTVEDKPLSIEFWAKSIVTRVQSAFPKRGLPLPELAVEPGRCIVGTAGVTLYRAGHAKTLPNGSRYLALDGGMADNPRPITYQARYTPAVANRVETDKPVSPITLVGKYCESGDIIIKEASLSAQTGDLIAVFDTGAYSYSQASNYNRTGRPACVLVKEGKADVIIERETEEDLIKQDRIPARLMD